MESGFEASSFGVRKQRLSAPSGYKPQASEKPDLNNNRQQGRLHA